MYNTMYTTPILICAGNLIYLLGALRCRTTDSGQTAAIYCKSNLLYSNEHNCILHALISIICTRKASAAPQSCRSEVVTAFVTQDEWLDLTHQINRLMRNKGHSA